MFSLEIANLHHYDCAHFYEYSGLHTIIVIMHTSNDNPCNMAHVLVM